MISYLTISKSDQYRSDNDLLIDNVVQLDKDSDGMINYQEFCDIVGKNFFFLSEHTISIKVASSSKNCGWIKKNTNCLKEPSGDTERKVL